MKRLFVQMGLLLAACCCSAAAMAGSCKTDTVRAMTYNVRLDTTTDGENSWAHRKDLFFGQLRLVRPDILGLQEVVPGQKSDLAAAFPDYAMIGGGRDDGRDAGEASPLMLLKNRYRIGVSGMFWLSPTPEVPSRGWGAAYPRIATWAHLTDRHSGQRVLAINTHWDHLSVSAREHGALQLRDWIAAHRQKSEAAVLIGDFNAGLDEASLQHLTAAGWRDARGASQEPSAGGAITFNGWQIVPTGGAAIDHVFVRDATQVQRYHVLAAHFDGRLASDHFAVVTDLLLNAPAKDCAAKPHA